MIEFQYSHMKPEIGAEKRGEKPKRRRMIASEVWTDQRAMNQAFRYNMYNSSRIRGGHTSHNILMDESDWQRHNKGSERGRGVCLSFNVDYGSFWGLLFFRGRDGSFSWACDDRWNVILHPSSSLSCGNGICCNKDLLVRLI